MNKKYIIGIISALILIFAVVSITNAAVIKKNQYKKLDDFSTSMAIQSGQIVGVKADMLATGGEYVDTDGTLKEYVGVRYYITVTGDATTTYTSPTGKFNLLYSKDALDPDANNAIIKETIRNDATQRFGWNLALQDITYLKKVPGNQ